MLDRIGLFHLTGDRMRYLTERQTVVARNIANADTPGYQAQDLAPFSPANSTRGAVANSGAGAAAPLVMARTQPGHLGLQNSSATFHHITSPSTYGEKHDGNNVSLEEQMVKSADVANNFALASAAYAKSIALMKIGIDSGK